MNNKVNVNKCPTVKMTQFEEDKKYYSADRMKIYVSIKETQSESLKIVYRTNTCIFHKNSNQAKNVDT